MTNGPQLDDGSRGDLSGINHHGEYIVRKPGSIVHGNADDNNDNKAVGGRIAFAPIPEFEVGVSGLYSQVGADRTRFSNIRAHFLGADMSAYSTPRGILADSARRLNGLPVLLVGIRCPIEIIMERRRNTWGAAGSADSPVPDAVHRWQREVHIHGIYDLEVDTSSLSSSEWRSPPSR